MTSDSCSTSVDLTFPRKGGCFNDVLPFPSPFGRGMAQVRVVENVFSTSASASVWRTAIRWQHLAAVQSSSGFKVVLWKACSGSTVPGDFPRKQYLPDWTCQRSNLTYHCCRWVGTWGCSSLWKRCNESRFHGCPCHIFSCFNTDLRGHSSDV